MLKSVNSLIFLSVIFFQLLKGSTDCDDYRECYGDSIDDDSITCDGYESCASSQLDFTDEVSCGGYLGCSTSRLDTTTGTVTCNGYQSCQNGNITSEGLVCTGSSGCYDIDGDVDGSIECDGYESCKDAYIYVRPTSSSSNRRRIYIYGNRGGQNLYLRLKGTGNKYSIYVYGYYGFENGTIYSGQDNDVNIRFFGYYSGYNATIQCKKNTDCEMKCYGNYACLGLTEECTSKATCNTYYLYADEEITSFDSDIFEKELPKSRKNLKNKKNKLSKKTNIKKDDITGNYGCYDDSSCADSTIEDVTGNAECYGYAACSGADISVSGDIECYNYESCLSANVDSTNLVCDGSYSCYSTTGSISGDLTCNGEYSCAYTTVTGASDISINGNYGGQETLFEFEDNSGTHNVYVGGPNGFDDGVILSGEDNKLLVTFSGYYAGNNSLVACDKNSDCVITCIDYGCVNLDIQEYYGGNATVTCIDDAYCPEIDDISVDSQISKLNFNAKFLNGFGTNVLNFISNNITIFTILAIFSVVFVIGIMYNRKNKNITYQPLNYSTFD